MIRLLIFCCISCSIFSCDQTDKLSDSGDCDLVVVKSASVYTNATSDEFTINSIELNGDCLVVDYSGSGCDGNSWEVSLIDSDNIGESEPPTRFLRFTLDDDEDCEAYITKNISFNISSLKENGGTYILSFQDYDQTIVYE